MTKCEMRFRVLTVIGGLSNNALYCQLLADICNVPVVVSSSNGGSLVLLGSSILGASNYSEFKDHSFNDLIKNFNDLNISNMLMLPNLVNQDYHEKKYKVFLRMLHDQQDYNEIMI
jgi:ribulose kinase